MLTPDSLGLTIICFCFGSNLDPYNFSRLSALKTSSIAILPPVWLPRIKHVFSLVYNQNAECATETNEVAPSYSKRGQPCQHGAQSKVVVIRICHVLCQSLIVVLEMIF